MRKLILHMALTLDGVASGEDGPIEGVDYNDEGVWSDLFTTLEAVDALVIGAGTQREYFGFWRAAPTSPTASANERRYAALAARTPHFVVSRTLRSAEWPNATVLRDMDALADLKQQPGRDIVLWGGPTVAAAVSDAGLIDEYQLVTHPVIAGRGKKLFTNAAATHRLRHLSTLTFPSGIVALKYARA